ncbi:hypothetical protein, partial [Pseudomonas aeruginosa]|uniref:hypothetical protein n=1 Tax=Pseudomonas aeruginosa TaxID=287 RepID=UPI002556C2FC
TCGDADDLVDRPQDKTRPQRHGGGREIFLTSCRPGARTLMTNSAKYAHYAPGLVSRQVRFAGLAGCVEAAVGGRAPAGLPAWLSEDC